MKRWMQLYHLMPPGGWLNDPNGLCQKDGIYHVFFQYTPENPLGGNKYWGHFQSTDLVKWEYTGIALSPDEPFDADGVYSGSALVDGKDILLFYTGNVEEQGDFDYVLHGRQANTVLVKTPDGIQMSGKEVVMTNLDYPDNCSCHVRDPKVWKEADTFLMVQGARTVDDRGQVLLFSSKDGVHWNYLRSLCSEKYFGYMWECPDYFVLDGASILSLSPQGVPCEEERFMNIYQSGYFQLNGYIQNAKCPDDFKEWDMGFDFYAPQTFLDESGRRILIGWMGLPDIDYHNLTVEDGWQHCLTVPRELSFRDGTVRQRPVKELENLRTGKIDVQWGTEICLPQCFEVVAQTLELYVEIGRDLVLEYSQQLSRFEMRFLGYSGAGRTIRRCHLTHLENVHILVDSSSVEAFINDGEFVFSTRFYPRGEERYFKINGNGTNLSVFQLGSKETGEKWEN